MRPNAIRIAAAGVGLAAASYVACASMTWYRRRIVLGLVKKQAELTSPRSTSAYSPSTR